MCTQSDMPSLKRGSCTQKRDVMRYKSAQKFKISAEKDFRLNVNKQVISA